MTYTFQPIKQIKTFSEPVKSPSVYYERMLGLTMFGLTMTMVDNSRIQLGMLSTDVRKIIVCGEGKERERERERECDRNDRTVNRLPSLATTS